MKKVIISIIFCLIYAISFAQTFTTIKKSIEIVKPIVIYFDERGKVFDVRDKEAFAHIDYVDCGDAGNVVEFWVDVDDEKYCFHFTENIEVTKMSCDKSIAYFIEDESFRYFMISSSIIDGKEVWSCDFRLR